MDKLNELLTNFPITSLVHLIVTIVLGVDLIIDGDLSKDAIQYAAVIEGGNGLTGIARGIRKSGTPVVTRTTVRRGK